MNLGLDGKIKSIAPIRAIFTAKWLFLLLGLLFVLFRFVVPLNGNVQLGLWKIMLGVAAATAGYITSKALHPNMSLSKLLEEDKTNELPDAIKLLGVLIYRGFIMAAFVVGILLGI